MTTSIVIRNAGPRQVAVEVVAVNVEDGTGIKTFTRVLDAGEQMVEYVHRGQAVHVVEVDADAARETSDTERPPADDHADDQSPVTERPPADETAPSA